MDFSMVVNTPPPRTWMSFTTVPMVISASKKIKKEVRFLARKAVEVIPPHLSTLIYKCKLENVARPLSHRHSSGGYPALLSRVPLLWVCSAIYSLRSPGSSKSRSRCHYSHCKSMAVSEDGLFARVCAEGNRSGRSTPRDGFVVAVVRSCWIRLGT